MSQLEKKNQLTQKILDLKKFCENCFYEIYYKFIVNLLINQLHIHFRVPNLIYIIKWIY